MYQVGLLEEAREELRKLTKSDRATARLIAKRLGELEANADSMRHEPLHADLAGFFKRRVGDFRIVYTIDHTVRSVTVYAIGNRRDIYRTLGNRLGD